MLEGCDTPQTFNCDPLRLRPRLTVAPSPDRDSSSHRDPSSDRDPPPPPTATPGRLQPCLGEKAVTRPNTWSRSPARTEILISDPNPVTPLRRP